MKKIILGAALLTSAFTSMFMAQSKLLAKTTWKIENIAADGNIVLKKTKHINLLAEEPKFNYLQFTDSKKYKTGNSYPPIYQKAKIAKKRKMAEKPINTQFVV
ncbi:hypothetical protein [Elizabethkingia anophelis]|uniref:hypothetical protein n=1 Tax=Elizabethkingia anophelis TaxID=1117645 RepID=UPI0038927317